MEYRTLGNTGLDVSVVSFGAAGLGGVYGAVGLEQAKRTVDTALDCGINYFDVSPAYGGTLAETVLGKCLAEVPRDRYILSTKVGKQTSPERVGEDSFDFSRKAILQSLEESRQRLGVDYIDLIHIHDLEYEAGTHIEQALSEGLDTLLELKAKGDIGGVSVGTYPMDLWERILKDYPMDAVLVHNHYSLNDTLLLELLPLAAEKGVGVINASPFAMGLLTDRGPASWHPASPEEVALFKAAASLCRERQTSIGKLAFQFATQHPDIPTTLFSTKRPEAVLENMAAFEEPMDADLVKEVQEIIRPLMNRDWDFANSIE